MSALEKGDLYDPIQRLTSFPGKKLKEARGEFLRGVIFCSPAKDKGTEVTKRDW